MAKAEKRTAAKVLYMTGKYDQNDIAKMLGVNVATISKWNKDEGWSEEFDRDTKIVNDSEAGIRELIHYNLTILKAKARKAQKQLEDGDVTDAAEMTLIAGKDIDGLSKLYAQIKRNELDFADKVAIISEFFAFASNLQPDLIEMIGRLTDGFIERISYKK